MVKPLSTLLVLLCLGLLGGCHSTKTHPLPINLDKQGVLSDHSDDKADGRLDFFLLEDWF